FYVEWSLYSLCSPALCFLNHFLKSNPSGVGKSRIFVHSFKGPTPVEIFPFFLNGVAPTFADFIANSYNDGVATTEPYPFIAAFSAWLKSPSPLTIRSR